MPLKKIFKDDLIIKSSTNYYEIFKIFLEHLVKTINLSDNKIKTISKYLKDNKPKKKKEFNRLLSFLPGPLPGTSLKDIFPEIAKQWHPTKNGDLTPDMVSKSSSTKYWWICNNGHEFNESVQDRVVRKKCKLCKTLLFKFPEISKEWHPTKNKKNPEDVYAGTKQKAWFICPKGHEYEASLVSRTTLRKSRSGTPLKKIGCVFCSGKKIGYGNDLQSNFPQIAKEWHPTKNGNLKPSEIFPGTNKKYWWICKNGHSYQANPNHRTSGKTGCRACYILKMKS